MSNQPTGGSATDDADSTGTPAIIHFDSRAASLTPTSVQVVGDNVEWTYSLTVGAGETKRLAYFTVLGTTRTAAIAAANALVTPNGFGGQAAAFLTAGELESLANFDFNVAPTAIALQNAVTALPEGTNTTTATVVGDIVVTDDGVGTNTLA